MKDTLLFVLAHYWFYFALAGLVVFFFVAIFLTACWDKHPIRQYQPGMPEEVAPPSAYFQAMNAAVGQFHFEGSGLVRICIHTFWWEPKHDR
ncbi:MAG TPA: hypothetical protein VG347_21780 [Verrucomicrobiae bacterium]|nr:hypothetical protein [Verrucomicrobiae bacterium]